MKVKKTRVSTPIAARKYRQRGHMVSRLLPDSLKGTMQELPALPSRHAYLLGWASEIPILTEISYLPKKARPKSDDPDFWDVWTRKEDRKIDWKAITDKWQGN